VHLDLFRDGQPSSLTRTDVAQPAKTPESGTQLTSAALMRFVIVVSATENNFSAH
jgi:hypothetical protein